MKKVVAGFITGIVMATGVSVYAASVTANPNTFMVTVNGNEANIEGYNINGSTYFKLRDVADAIGGFSTGFENNVITITTNATGEPPSIEDMKTRLAQEVAEGKLTQEQADEMLTQMENGNMQDMSRGGNPPQGMEPPNQ